MLNSWPIYRQTVDEVKMEIVNFFFPVVVRMTTDQPMIVSDYVRRFSSAYIHPFRFRSKRDGPFHRFLHDVSVFHRHLCFSFRLVFVPTRYMHPSRSHFQSISGVGTFSCSLLKNLIPLPIYIPSFVELSAHCDSCFLYAL